MSRPVTWPSTGIRGALDRATNLVRETTVRQAWYDLGWQWLACLAGLVVLDLMLDLPVWVRWVGLIGLVAFAVVGVARIRKSVSKRPFSEEQTARMLEEAQPGMDSVLINAVQFQRVIDAAPGSQADLMRFEISRAESAVNKTPMEAVVSRAGEQKALRLLLIAIGVWAVAAVGLSGPLFTVLPRLFAPWMDDVTPPFSLTKIELNPKGATVRYGGALIVTASVSGPIPDELKLSTRTPKGDWTQAPFASADIGKYTLTLSGLREDTWIVARGGTARSARYLIKVVLPPIGQSLEAKYTYPAYTSFKPATETVGDQGIHGLRDTKVALSVTANRALSGGELIVQPEKGEQMHFPLTVDSKDATKAAGNFPITGSGKFRIALTSSDSQTNDDAAHGKVVMEHDQRPTVWFNQPAPEVVVTPKMKVVLEVEAQDDIGVERVDLHRQIDGIADNNQTLFEGTPVKHTDKDLTLDMGDLGVRPGDELVYYANAYDNDPGHPNFAQTDPYKIKVVSDEDYQKLLKDQRDTAKLTQELNDIKDAIGSLADRQQQLAQKMEHLQKALQKKPGDPGLQKQMAAAQQEQKKLQDDAKKLSQDLKNYAQSPSASPMEEALKQKVGGAADAIAKAAEAMQAAQGKPGAPSVEAAKKAAESLNKTAGKAEQQVGQALKNIEQVAPLFADVEKFRELLNRQGQLVLQARDFQDSSPKDDASRSKMEAISDEQQKIQEGLKQLQDDLRRHAAEAQKDFPKASASAVKIADEIGKREIPQLMGSAHDGFSQESGPAGYGPAKRALEQMEAMLENAGACQSNSKGELDIKLLRSLGKPGLGQSLGQGSSGSGMGSGDAGTPIHSPGSVPGSSEMKGPVAYTMKMNSLTNESSREQAHSQNVNAGSPASLSPDRVETLPNGDRKPPKASDDAATGYPSEYRKMVRDYFISVTKEKKH